MANWALKKSWLLIVEENYPVWGGLLCLAQHPASLPYSSVTLLVSHAPLNYLGFFEPYVAFVFVIFIQGGLKTGKKNQGGSKGGFDYSGGHYKFFRGAFNISLLIQGGSF